MGQNISDLDGLSAYAPWLEVVKVYVCCQKLLARELDSLGLSVAQHEVLLAVARDEGLSQKAVATKLLVTKSNITALLDRMETAGLVERTPNPNDARSRSIFLTTEGRRLFKRAAKKQARVVKLMARQVNEAELDTLARVMKRVRTNLESALQ